MLKKSAGSSRQNTPTVTAMDRRANSMPFLCRRCKARFTTSVLFLSHANGCVSTSHVPKAGCIHQAKRAVRPSIKEQVNGSRLRTPAAQWVLYAAVKAEDIAGHPLDPMAFAFPLCAAGSVMKVEARESQSRPLWEGQPSSLEFVAKLEVGTSGLPAPPLVRVTRQGVLHLGEAPGDPDPAPAAPQGTSPPPRPFHGRGPPLFEVHSSWL
jgi:hypothetical protein